MVCLVERRLVCPGRRIKAMWIAHDSALAGKLSRPWLSPVLAGLLRLGRTVVFVYGPFRLPGAVGKRGRWLTLPYDCSQQYQTVKFLHQGFIRRPPLTIFA